MSEIQKRFNEPENNKAFVDVFQEHTEFYEGSKLMILATILAPLYQQLKDTKKAFPSSDGLENHYLSAFPVRSP
jgi:hypothetical protein